MALGSKGLAGYVTKALCGYVSVPSRELHPIIELLLLPDSMESAIKPCFLNPLQNHQA